MHAEPRRTKVLWIRDAYLAEILAGRKTIEVRVAYSNVARLRPSDILRLNDRHNYEIARIARYERFEALLAGEPHQLIAPGLSSKELLAALRALYPPEKEALGVIALAITPLEPSEPPHL